MGFNEKDSNFDVWIEEKCEDLWGLNCEKKGIVNFLFRSSQLRIKLSKRYACSVTCFQW
jgi:hypothetical protein